MAPSRGGRYVFVAGEDGKLVCFDAGSGEVKHSMELADKGVAGLVAHPHRNLLAAYGTGGALALLKP